MHKVLYVCILISLPLNIYSQQIKGKVTNEQGQSLENVLITAKLVNNESLEYTTSNSDGDFSFSKLDKGTYEVVVKSIGYVAFIDTITVKGDTNAGEIVLKQRIIELDDITVMSEIPAIKNTNNGVVVNVDNSYFKSLPLITDVLSQIPEISIDNGVIAVLGKKNIGYYVNGKQSNFNPANIAVASIDKIEVITSPSAKYDANMEAVINIILKKNAEQGFNGEISTQYEQRSKPRYDLSGVFNYNRGIFHSTITLNHGYSISADSKTVAEQKFYTASNPYIRKYVQNNRYRSHSEVYGAEFSLNFSETNVLSFQATWQPNYVPFEYFEQRNDFFSNTGQPDSASVSEVNWKYHTRFANAGLKYDFKINRLKMDAQFDWLWQDDLTNTDNKFDFDNFATIDRMKIQTRQFRKSAAYVPSLNGNYDFGRSKLDFGVKYYFVESLLNLDFSEVNAFTPENDFAYDATENIFAVYGVFNSNIKRLTYEIGLRGEFSTLKGNFNIHDANQTLNEFLPSVSISYPINDKQNISLSYKKNVLRPPFSRISPLYYFTGPFDAYEGNPYLKPAVLSSFQLKYLFGNKSITLIYNNNKDMMGTFPFIRDNDITVQKYFNYNQTVIGAVLGLPVKHASWLNGQYTLRLYNQTVENTDVGSVFKATIMTSSVNIAENIKLPKAYTVNILFNYSLPQYIGANKIKTCPGINFSFAKNFNDNFSVSLYLRDIFKINNKSITSRDLDGINFYSTNYWDSRGVNISLTYKFQKGRQTDTKTFNSDEIGNRL
ncbi:MAG: TonB-dependent receptor [Prevotellaceae bacterium]|nr:TonB-dependent receptor [Prevotellaceae bacterium]